MKRLKRALTRLLFKAKILNRKPPPLYTKDVLKGGSFSIGEYSYGIPLVLFQNNEAKLYIGKFCSIAQNVTIFLGGNHRLDWVSTYPFMEFKDFSPNADSISGHPSTNGDVVIENDVWLGRGVTIMSGVHIANGAVIATGSIVTKDVGAYEVWGGNPAKLISKRFENNKIDLLLKLNWWDWDIKKIKQKAPILCSSNFELLVNEEL